MAAEIRRPLKRLLPHLVKAREDNLNEADTLLMLPIAEIRRNLDGSSWERRGRCPRAPEV